MHKGIGTLRKSIVLVLVIVSGLIAAGCQDGTLSVLTTNDSHSHLLGDPVDQYDPTVTGDGTQGGAARVATIIAEAREANENLMAFSAGDTYEVKAWYGLAQWLQNLGTVPLRFSDDTTVNPIGPPWRRVWDIQKYGEPGFQCAAAQFAPVPISTLTGTSMG